ncbi:hypothetical protein ACEQ8H_004849 [Pleosporales sp. CAS-2024a]
MKHLPDEILLHIISYLEPAELVTLQHVSRHLRHLARDDSLWKTLCFSHSVAERRRRRLTAFDASARVHDPLAPRAASPRTTWDPAYPHEKVNWYHDFIQRHAPPRIGWFQDARSSRQDENGNRNRHEATGAAVLFDSDGLADRLVAPMYDGSIRIWDARASSDTQGRMLATSNTGLLSSRGPDLDRDPRLGQSRAMMTETGAVECVSIDSTANKAYFAVGHALTEIDLHTLQLVSRTPYPFAITALSEAHHSTPLTVATNWTLHLHDTRRPPTLASALRCELMAGPPHPSFSRLRSGDFGSHVTLSQPGALSILHMPTARSWDGNGDIWVCGRFTSMLNFDRRFFPRLRGTVHSGARLSCLTCIPHPFIPQSLRTSYPPAHLRAAKEMPGTTLIAAGEYKGKGSLELYGLSSEPTRTINSSDSRTTRNPQACYMNRQTASASKLLAAAPHGTRIVMSDGEGNLKWVERDGSTPVRHVNISDLDARGGQFPIETQQQQQHLSNPLQSETQDAGDIVKKIMPTCTYTPRTADHAAQANLILWTGDGKLGLLGFGADDPLHAHVWADALERQEDHGGEKRKEREYGAEIRRALEMQARELRWLRGYGL